MSLQYIIDGYNIIKHPLCTQRLNKKIKDSRAALLEFIKLNKLCGSPKNKTTVVFDGHPDSGGLRDDTGINVVFSRKESADEKIRRIVEKGGNAKNIVVVSDDKEIKFFVSSIGARTLGVEEFINPKKHFSGQKEDSLKAELTYSQMQKINQELRNIWLK